MRVSEGTRTPDRLDHNQELYQLSYAHHGLRSLAPSAQELRAICSAPCSPPAQLSTARRAASTRSSAIA
jgi:hypothetical protein